MKSVQRYDNYLGFAIFLNDIRIQNIITWKTTNLQTFLKTLLRPYKSNDLRL